MRSTRSSRIWRPSSGVRSRWRSLFQLGHVLCRSRAWFNTLRAAYPNEPIQWRRIAGSYVAGVGVNSILPARAGDVTKIYLAKQSVPNSTYPAVTSSFFVDSVFDTPVGPAGAHLRDRDGDAAEPQPAAEPARVRPRLLGGPSALRPLHDHVGDARAAGPVRGAVGARGGVLEADQAGRRDPHGLPALPAPGRQLDGRRHGCCASPASTSSSRRSTSAARSRTCCS